MLKKIYAGIYLLILATAINTYAAEHQADSSIPNFTRSSGTDNPGTQFNSQARPGITIKDAHFNNPTINHHEFRETRYVAYKAYNDPDTTFGQKIKNSFAEGCWESFQSIPGVFTHIIMQTATTLLMKKFVDWFNGMPSEAPTAAERDLTNFTREEMVDIARTQMLLQVNSEALKGLRDELKIFENDPEECSKLEERKQELLQNRKELNAQFHAMVNASTQAQSKNKLVFSYPKAA